MSKLKETPRILLIGVAGQLGWELRRSLRPLGELTLAARNGADDVVPLDLADADQIRAIVRDVRPQLIVNAAAYALVDQAEKEPDVAMAVNGEAPGLLQKEANRLGAAVVHYSTDYVFDGTGSKPWLETDPTGPLGAYGRSKLAGEQAVAAAGGSYVILRTSWVYGIHGVNFVKKILKLAQDRETLKIVDDQIGAPTSARYLADVTTSLLAQARSDFAGLLRERGGLFHCCCGGETSWFDFTQTIVEAARAAGMNLKVAHLLPIPSSEFPTPARRPLNSRLNCDRLRQEFGLVTPSWQAALADTLPTLLRYEFGLSR
jgi:dTDP-4-dehydrorhamnose reductase